MTEGTDVFDLAAFLDANLVLDSPALAQARSFLRECGYAATNAEVRAVRAANRRWVVRPEYLGRVPPAVSHLLDALYLALRAEARRRNASIDWVVPRLANPGDPRAAAQGVRRG